jgi:flagellar protein FliT
VSTVDEIFGKTEEIHDWVIGGLPKNEREAYIEKLNKLLAERQELLDQLPPSSTEGDLKLGEKILALNRKFEPVLAEQMKMIQSDLQNVKHKKKTNTKYANPYQSTSADGMFFDKRK